MEYFTYVSNPTNGDYKYNIYLSPRTNANDTTDIHQIASYTNDAAVNVGNANYYDYQLVFNATA